MGVVYNVNDKCQISQKLKTLFGYGMFSHFGDAMAYSLRHRVIYLITIATHWRSRSLQALSQSQWPKVGLINDHLTNRRSCNWRIKMCGKTKKAVNRRLTLNIKLIGD